MRDTHHRNALFELNAVSDSVSSCPPNNRVHLDRCVGNTRPMPPKADFTVGGFRGLPTAERIRPSDFAGQDARRRGDQVRASRESLDDRPVKHLNEQAVRMAEVPMEGWEREKEKRVHTAFHRIVEREWFDKFEANLKAVEQVHVNAVREHFAMRRDKLKTPDVKCRKGGNAIGREDWARNVEALNQLQPSTNIGTHFRGLVGRQRYQRMHGMPKPKQQAAQPPPSAAPVAGTSSTSYDRGSNISADQAEL
jgi:hypothetical protein